jgi:hypothetical protein
MTILLHGQEIESIFDLLGHNENGLTYALGWVLSNNQMFLRELVKRVSNKKFECRTFEVRLQEFQIKDHGYTDIELLIDDCLFIIIEAKIGWTLPKQMQIGRYVSRFKPYNTEYTKKFLILSECRREYATESLNQLKSKIPLEYLSWHEINTLIQEVSKVSSIKERRLASEFRKYFQEVVNVQNLDSNKVYCVVLNEANFERVTKNNQYNYPLGKYWPRDPPNYIALRYKGKLHAIHHVDDFEIKKRNDPKKRPLMRLYLGKPFKPINEVNNGNIYANSRCCFDLDTAFTCKTIEEAVNLIKKRKAEV